MSHYLLITKEGKEEGCLRTSNEPDAEAIKELQAEMNNWIRNGTPEYATAKYRITDDYRWRYQ